MGITGLETAIILIAFVVVAAVFAYTVLSAGLFSSQKSEQAVHSGLEEAQSTLEVKGSVSVVGRAELNDCDYPTAWTPDADDVTMTRETTEYWEGSASLKAVVADATAADETLVVHAMEAMDLTIGDTIVFWLKVDADLDQELTFAVDSDATLSGGTALLDLAIDTSVTGTGWQRYTVDVDHDTDFDVDLYYGIWCDSLTANGPDNFYLDKVMFEDVASMGGISFQLNNCDYPVGPVADDPDNVLTRETTDYMEGVGAMKNVVTTAVGNMIVGDEIFYHAMEAKDWSNGDTITFWIKADLLLDADITFALATSADLSGTATETYVIDTAGTDWEQHTVTLSGDDDDTAGFYGIYLSTDPTDATHTFYLDGIEIDAKFSKTTDPMTTFVKSMVLTASTMSSGRGLNFTTTADTGTSKATWGVISDETTKTHRMIIYYNDSNQQVTDLTWTKTGLGYNDGDDILEDREKYELTVDLTYVNNNAGHDYKKVVAGQKFSIELKPERGSVLHLERTLPAVLKNVNDLY
ncbi:MAG TPA: hypothetical protein G4O07_00180 [Dehalococcoidia bacterium]|nr:hypothetical protein [Dehalococcoidia bacterium]